MRFHLILMASLLLSVISFGQSPELIVPLPHTETITAVDFSYDGAYVLSASLDQQIKVW